MGMDFSKEAAKVAAMLMCLNGLDPKEHMFMYHDNGTYAVKNIDSRKYTFFRGGKVYHSEFEMWLAEIA